MSFKSLYDKFVTVLYNNPIWVIIIIVILIITIIVIAFGVYILSAIIGAVAGAGIGSIASLPGIMAGAMWGTNMSTFIGQIYITVPVISILYLIINSLFMMYTIKYTEMHKDTISKL